MNNNEVKQVFNDLDDLLRFCKVFGHPYDESYLYNTESAVYNEYAAFKGGKRISNNWIRDAKLTGARIFGPNS